MTNERIDRLRTLLSGIRIGCTIRYQAYEYAKEGTPEYAFVAPFCVDATAHLRKLLEYAEEAEQLAGSLTVRESVEDTSIKYASVHMALRRLVLLKEYKDEHGKDAHYEEEQPYAWKQARTALTQIEDREGA